MPGTTKRYRQNKWADGIQGTGCEAIKGSDPWKMGTNRGKPYSCPSLLPGESLQYTAQRGEPRRMARDLPELNRQRQECGEAQGMEFTRQRTRENSAQMELGCPAESPLESSAQHWWAREKVAKAGSETIQKDERKIIIRAHRRLRILSVPTNPS